MLWVIKLTSRYGVRGDIGSWTGGISSIEVVYCVLTIVEEVKGLLGGVMTFLVHVILKQSGGVPAIKLGVQDAVHIL